MAQDIDEPMTDAEIDALRDEIQSQRVEIREYLAEELGGASDDYRADTYLSDRAGTARPDGGE